MRRLIVPLLLVLVCSCSTRRDVSTNAAKARPGRSADDTINVMTFNVRFASATPPNAWWQRRGVLRDCIRQENPDLIGTQEGVYPQLRDMAEDMGQEYDWIGLGREGGSRGEFMAVFYRKGRFVPLEYDHFWLSDTPGVIGSASWGNRVKRMVTWVKFLDNQTSKQFYFWNTHFDHQVQPSREKSAELVKQRVEALKTELPVILVGDFNATARKNRAYEILTEGGFFADTYTDEEAGTFHNFSGTPGQQGRIDWILLRGPVKTVGSTRIVRYNQNGQYPSDHFPVVVPIQLGS